MAKQKYVKIQVNIAVGNRKASVVDPVEVDEDTNTFEGELNTVLLDVVDAIKSLPCVDGSYTRDDVVDAMCASFALRRVDVQ